MNSAQQSANEQIQQFSHMQSKAFQPMRIFSGLAAEAMEQVVRKNYAVMGDFVEFSVKQAQLPLRVDNAGDILSAQMDELSTFGELMNSRASEYVELVSTLSEHARKATDDAAAQVREVADDAAEQTKRVVEKAVVYTQQATDEVSNNVQNAADDKNDNVKVTSNRARKTATGAKKSA